MNEYRAPKWLTTYQDFKTLCSAVSGEYIRFYLTTGCDAVTYTHSQNTRGLPRYSCLLTAEDGATLLLELDEWIGRMDEVSASVRAWLAANASLRGCRPNRSHYAGDSYWRRQWQLANPW
ncbi:hypothetical protein [Brevibacterium casei]|uniref:Uncharacterized protein n=1 Tax=Brevibacterium casei CIP 102111 TaxID=1255625 RepID=A0A2H1HWD4_9MICO|nr:hypothetical protein [Brevibacterium casei]QPR38235.1 hypothetical protein I6G94_11610 [Brevibacterium casei]QPR42400.1 hypothetical protein I6G93_09245 [Brevibacterium casei]SMX67156.1 hypothetical protein BC102111_00705 [Brevibacterium casei CIP 102111]